MGSGEQSETLVGFREQGEQGSEKKIGELGGKFIFSSGRRELRPSDPPPPPPHSVWPISCTVLNRVLFRSVGH